MKAVYDEMFVVMLTGRIPSGAMIDDWDIPALQKGFTVDGRGFDVHGDDKDGNWDLEFPSMFEAIEWYSTWKSDLDGFNIRKGDTVADMHNPVVMTITPNFKF